MIDRMFSVDEVARITGWHPMTIYRKGTLGEIPGRLKLGRNVRFRESAIEQWLKDVTEEKPFGELVEGMKFKKGGHGES